LRLYFAAAMLAAIILGAYANSFGAGFVLDNSWIVSQAQIQEFNRHNLDLILSHTYWWPHFESGLYRPVASFTWLLNYAVLGNETKPAGYHSLNILLHLGNAMLVFALARRLLRDSVRAWVVTAIWAVYPVQTEVVTNIVGRADMLAAMSILAGLLIHIRSTETTGWRRWAWLATLLVVAALGLFSKESAVAVLGVIALYEITFGGRERWRSIVRSCLATAPAFAALLWARHRVTPQAWAAQIPFVDNPIAGAGFWAAKATALKVLALYVWRLIWPVPLSADYSYAQIRVTESIAIGLLLVFVWACAAALTIPLYRRNKAAFFAIWFAFVTILPVSNLLLTIGTIMGERFLYLPAFSAALCITMALYAGARRLHAPRYGALAAGLVIVALFGVRTWFRNADWHDDLTFWSTAVRTSPESFKTHNSLAEELVKPGQIDYEGALREDDIALRILRDVPPDLDSTSTYFGMARHAGKVGDSFLRQQYGVIGLSPESLKMYARSKALLMKRLEVARAHPAGDIEPVADGQSAPEDPALMGKYAEVHSCVLLSQADQLLGNRDESLQWALEAERLGPMRPWVYQGLHDAYAANGRRQEAMDALTTGLILTASPDLERKLLSEYADRGETTCAITFDGATPRLNPQCASVRQAACAAAPRILAIANRTSSAALSKRLRNELRESYGCLRGEARPQ
jgi:protein O-mannosyl-transferase